MVCSPNSLENVSSSSSEVGEVTTSHVVPPNTPAEPALQMSDGSWTSEERNEEQLFPTPVDRSPAPETPEIASSEGARLIEENTEISVNTVGSTAIRSARDPDGLLYISSSHSRPSLNNSLDDESMH